MVTQFLQPHNARATRPHAQTYVAQADQSGLQQICLWGEASDLGVFRQRVSRLIREPHLRLHIVKCQRVQQQQGNIRFDMWITRECVTAVLQQLKAGRQRYGWFFRPHIPYCERVGRGISDTQRVLRQPQPPPAAQQPGNLHQSSSLKVGSLNINGVNRKRSDLRYFLERTQVDVLGIQETLLRSTDWYLRFPGYKCYTAMGETTASTRGLALIVSNRFQSTPVGRSSLFWIFARVHGGGLKTPVIIGTVYVPHREDRARVLTGLPQAIEHLSDEYREEPIILTGDFNMELHELQLKMANWPCPLQALGNRGSVPTRRNRGGVTARTIDHIAFRGTLGPGCHPPRPRVMQGWDLSDHFPVVARFPGMVGRAPQATAAEPNNRCRPKIRVKREDRDKIASGNYWMPLAEEFDTLTEDPNLDGLATLQDMATKWEHACHEVAEDQQLYPEDQSKRVSKLPRAVAAAIKRRRKAFKSLREAEQTWGCDHVEAVVAKLKYDALAKQAKMAIRRNSAKAFYRQIQRNHHHMLANPRAFWQWAARTGGWRSKGAPVGIQPVYDETGILLTDSQAILERWEQHFNDLASDVTGHSRDFSHWDFLDPLPPSPQLTSLEEEFTRGEVWEALDKMKYYKAPGWDGIPADFLKGCLAERRSRDDEEGEEGEYQGDLQLPEDPDMAQEELEAAARRVGLEETASLEEVNEARAVMLANIERGKAPMTYSLTALLNWAYRMGVPAESWWSSIVIALPKKGDLADVNNYRGISLMSTTLKVLTVLLSGRINEAAEEHKLFSQAQAGFRRLEECVTQAACVVDTLQRRRNVGLTTYATFVDFKKAYDVVPHGALFAKLSRFGIRGRCLQFIKGLYEHSTIQVRLGSGSEARYTTPCPLRRGLRQG